MSELSDEQKQQLEAKYTYRRVLELSISPVQGNFDAAHLREINRRIPGSTRPSLNPATAVSIAPTVLCHAHQFKNMANSTAVVADRISKIKTRRNHATTQSHQAPETSSITK